MKIEIINKTVEKTVRNRGYKAVVKCNQTGVVTPSDFPMAKISTPTIKQRTGRRKGTVTLRTEVTLSRLAEMPDASGDEADNDAETELRQTLFDDALAIIDALESMACVCEVKCAATENSRSKTTPSGDASLVLALDVKLKYGE
ncbi:MAG: hypothetical protein J6K81_02580 [Rikenellaceae bacterium]|nr:hypothetical protein [Rikenellaceae bacterium]